MRPALDGLDKSVFLAAGEVDLAIRVDSKEVMPVAKVGHFDANWLDYVELTAAASSLAGTKEEIDAARREIFGTNLANWVIAWGNNRFKEQVGEIRRWYKERLMANLPAALTARCVELTEADLVQKGQNSPWQVCTPRARSIEPTIPGACSMAAAKSRK